MSKDGEEIERLQALKAKLVKTEAREVTLADRNRALVRQHETRAERAYEQRMKLEAKLDALLDKKLATIDQIQTDSGEWE